MPREKSSRTESTAPANTNTEPSPSWPAPRPVVTPASAAWLVRQISEFLPSEPKLLASLADRQRELEAEGHERADATAHVARELLQMSADNQPPLDGSSLLARAVRVCAQKILTSSWRKESVYDPMVASYADAARIAREGRPEHVHTDPASVVVLGPKITNTIHAGVGVLKIGDPA